MASSYSELMDTSNIKAHMQISHLHGNRSLNSSYADSDEDDQLSLCCLCGKTFPTISSLHSHIDSDHGDAASNFELESLPEPVATDSYYSESLPQTVSKTELSQNSPVEGNAEAKFSCPVCKRHFRGEFSLKVHIETIHNGHRSAMCELCQKRFSTLSYLRLHIATVHEGLKAYECVICSKRYTQKHSLKKHILTTHRSGHSTNGNDSKACQDFSSTFAAVLASSNDQGETIDQPPETEDSAPILANDNSQQTEIPHTSLIQDYNLEVSQSSHRPCSITQANTSNDWMSAKPLQSSTIEGQQS